MEWLKWVFDGIGTYVLSAIVGFFSGFAGGFVSIKFTKVNQTQIAGEGAQQNHAEHMNIYNISGITEERVREIIDEQVQYALVGCTDEAYPKGRERISKFEDYYMSRIKNVDNAFQSFADPAFRILLRDALQSAASTDRESDYGLLSELLVCYVQKGEDHIIRAAIHYAVKIVGEIDYKALCALSVAHTFANFIPQPFSCDEGLRIMNNVFKKLMDQDLPEGKEWLNHLDILDAVRVMPIGYNKKGVFEFYSKETGYTSIGIQENSMIHKKAIEILESAKISRVLFIPNECLNGYVRLPISNETSIDKMYFVHGTGNIPLNNEHKQALRQVLDMYSHDPQLQKQVQDNFIKKWDSFDSLHKFRLWWESIPQAFEITLVGRILAHTNAKRCDPELPDLIINWRKQP